MIDLYLINLLKKYCLVSNQDNTLLDYLMQTGPQISAFIY